jgi:HEAT repeat protein
MISTCPTCDKPVDPLRSRFAGVLDGRVVAYCSAACAGSASRAQAATVVPGAGGVSTGVPARIPTPPAGLPAVARPATGISDGPPRPITPAPGVPINIDSGPVIEIQYEPASGVVTSARPEHAAPRIKHAEEAPTAVGAIDPAAGPEPSGAVRTTSDPGSGPVKRSGASRGGPVDPSATGATARSHTDRARALAEPDGEVAPPRKSRAPLVLLILLLLAAGGVLAYRYFVTSDLAAATKVLPPPAAPAAQASQLTVADPVRAPVVDAAPAIDVAGAVEQARATLQANLTSTSPRVARVAAAALARTQDRAALDVLAAELGLAAAREPGAGSGGASQNAGSAARSPETSDLAKLALAYALARGGDKRGSDALAAALGAPRADVRDEAARLLTLLGDRRGVPHLTDVLAVSQRRLGAAEHLAHLAEPHAIKVLEQIRGDARAAADDRIRATIALGIAGHPDVAPSLRDMLGDAHFNAFAAAALAELKDEAARPVLEHQLASPMLIVRAARALRRLDPAFDPRPVLPHLLAVLASGRDIDQIQAAEAILLLAGPAGWSAYD